MNAKLRSYARDITSSPVQSYGTTKSTETHFSSSLPLLKAIKDLTKHSTLWPFSTESLKKFRKHILQQEKRGK